MRLCLPALWLLLGVTIGSFAQVSSTNAGQSAQAPSSATQNASVQTTIDKNKKEFEPSEGSRWHFHLGAVTVGGGYFSDPFYPYGPYPYDNYGPYPYSPFTEPKYSAEALWVPYVPGGPARSPLDLSYRGHRGEIKLAATPETAEVYIDGALAGSAGRLKHIWLDPGAYDLAVSSPGFETFHQRLYVLTGKTLKVEATLLQPN